MNPLRERGALAMAEMLKHNTTLKELNMMGVFYMHNISDSGAKALVESLAVNQHLKKLVIQRDHKRSVESLSVYQDHKERVKFSWY